MNNEEKQPGQFSLEAGDPAVARLTGDWSIRGLGSAERDLARADLPRAGRVELDGTGLARLDTAGAWLVVRLVADLRERGLEVALTGFSGEGSGLVELAGAGLEGGRGRPPERKHLPPLERLGRYSASKFLPLFAFLTFCGDVFLSLVRCFFHVAHFRGGQVSAHVYNGGLRAVPITGLLSFLMGVVIAYQGAVLLRLYGADIFTVDLVALSMARELSPLITAIIVAGRTGSAYTAQIGTMNVTEEIDALRTIGVGPMEYLVLPRLIALLIALPLLTVFCILMGIAGGYVMVWIQLDMSMATFIDRLDYALTFKSFMLGMIKAPVFAAIIALIGCYQGFNVRGGAESVGHHTTVCVVQSLFLVIAVDALFSVYFSWLGL